MAPSIIWGTLTIDQGKDDPINKKKYKKYPLYKSHKNMDMKSQKNILYHQ